MSTQTDVDRDVLTRGVGTIISILVELHDSIVELNGINVHVGRGIRGCEGLIFDTLACFGVLLEVGIDRHLHLVDNRRCVTIVRLAAGEVQRGTLGQVVCALTLCDGRRVENVSLCTLAFTIMA